MEETKEKTKRIVRNIAMKAAIETHDRTPLIGNSSALDSLAFVNFIVAVEHKVRSEFGIALTLTNDRAFSRTQNPFETVGSLVDYITELVDE